MTNIEFFEDLPVWQDARKLTQDIYKATGPETFSEDEGLKDRIRERSASIMSTVAEGFELQEIQSFIKSLYLTKELSGDLRSRLYVALDSGYLEADYANMFNERLKSISKQCTVLIQFLEKNSPARGNSEHTEDLTTLLRRYYYRLNFQDIKTRE